MADAKHRRPTAYRGDERFAFVSYAHEDAARVHREIEAIAAEGLNVYYDEGIHPGHAWHEDLAHAIQRCAVFLIFFTDRSVANRNCQRELTFALDNDKPVLAVLLDDVELPPGMRLAVGDRQAIIRSQFDDPTYRRRLTAALAEFLGSDGSSVPTPPPSDSAAAQSPGSARRWILGGSIVALLAVGYASYSVWHTNQAERAAAAAQLEQIRSLVQQDRYGEAYTLARPLMATDDAQLGSALRGVWHQIVEPAIPLVKQDGATLWFKPYDDVDGPWVEAGTTPFEVPIDLPKGVVRIRLEKPGFRTGEFAIAIPGPSLREPARIPSLTENSITAAPLELASDGAIPDGMVLVPRSNTPVFLTGWTQQADGDYQRDVPEFAIARAEVTNLDFKAFVDAGGYANPVYWKGFEFLDGDRTLSWDEARSRFVDRTGRPGPAGWEVGQFPASASALPVGGISWYEATAYARYRGLSLPTIHHWVRAAFAPYEGMFETAPMTARASRFLADSPIGALDGAGLGPWGTLNMAGNVREWVSNWTGRQAIALGGAWGDYFGTYQLIFTATPMDRAPDKGLRLMRNLAPLPADMLEPIELAVDDAFVHRSPVSDDAFEAMRFQFTARARTPAAVAVERIQASDAWTVEEVVLTYGPDDAFTLYVVKPREPATGLQPVLYVPTGDAFSLRRPSREVLDHLRLIDFVVNSGRALVIPIWANSYHRWQPPSGNAADSMDRQRNLAFAWYADYVATMAYVASRTDLDVEHAGVLGISAGAFLIVPELLALDDRLKAAILMGAGISTTRRYHPMIDAVNYAPHIRQPVLMLNGRFDSLFPRELSQQRLFDLLGSPPGDKRQVVWDEGHFNYPRNQLAREAVDWLDRYLGPVR